MDNKQITAEFKRRFASEKRQSINSILANMGVEIEKHDDHMRVGVWDRDRYFLNWTWNKYKCLRDVLMMLMEEDEGCYPYYSILDRMAQ